jgi:hypothetical protein
MILKIPNMRENRLQAAKVCDHDKNRKTNWLTSVKVGR